MEELNDQSASLSNGKIRTFASPQVLAAILDDSNSEITSDTQNLSTNNSSVVENMPEDFAVRESNSRIDKQLQSGMDFPETPNHLERDQQQEFSSETTAFAGSPSCQTSDGKPEQTEQKSRSHFIARNKIQVAVRSKPKTYAEIHAVKLRKKENLKLAQRVEKKDTSLSHRRKDEEEGITHEAQGDPAEAYVEEFISGDQHRDFETGSLQDVLSTARHTDHWSANNLFSARYNEQQASDHLDSAHYNEQQASDHLDSSFQRHTSRQLPYNQIHHYGSGRVSGIEHVNPLEQMVPRLPPIQQGQGHGIQSAPPGMYSYIRNQPLVHHLGYFYDFENVLSSTLPNSDFINLKNNKAKENSKLRRFVSEPHLASNSKDKNKNSKASYQNNYVNPQRRVEYKPYTLTDFKRLQEEKVENFGRSLGPNTGTEEHREKALRNFRQKEYGEEVRAQHSNMRRTWRQAPAHSTVNPSKKQAEDRRKAAINYSKTVPKPVTFKKNKDRDADKEMQGSPVSDNERCLTVIELLKIRHEKEKDEIELIRKQLSAKIRQ